MTDYDFFKPVTREEWQLNLEQDIKDGLARPGDTYEDYLAQVARACYGLDRDGNKIR
jgi:hypothetical protein